MKIHLKCPTSSISFALVQPFNRIASAVADNVMKRRRIRHLSNWNRNADNWKHYCYLPMRGLVADFNYAEHLSLCLECGIDLPNMQIVQTFRRCYTNWRTITPVQMSDAKNKSQTFLLHVHFKEDLGNTQAIIVEITTETIGSQVFKVAQIRGTLRPTTIVRYRPHISKGF